MILANSRRVRDEDFNDGDLCHEVRFTLCKILLVSQRLVGLKPLRSIFCATGLWVTYESGEKVHQVKSGGTRHMVRPKHGTV